MDRQSAIYVAALIEAILREDPGTVMGAARDEFMLWHGTFGLKQLFIGERALRQQWQIPDSTGKIDVEE